MRAVDRAHRLGSEGLPPGAVVTDGGCELEVIATPGHTSDSVSLYLRADLAVLTGDTVLGRGTTVIADDGSLADYLGSLSRLRALAETAELRTLLPGHGPLLASPLATLDFYLTHRAERLAEIRAALAAGDRTTELDQARVYADGSGASRSPRSQSARYPLGARRAAYRGDCGAGPAHSPPRRSRSGSISSTDLADSWSQPRAAKSASALLTVSLDAPTSWASSSCVRSWLT